MSNEDKSIGPEFNTIGGTGLSYSYSDMHLSWFHRQEKLMEEYRNGKDSPDLLPAYREQLKRDMK